jgi:hypothetical protein
MTHSRPPVSPLVLAFAAVLLQATAGQAQAGSEPRSPFSWPPPTAAEASSRGAGRPAPDSDGLSHNVSGRWSFR